ncbi:histidine kinase [Allosphingosinicella sp.]|uniref:histidine kinase n=1 Tax=Allosphingosinicella sp. TaxID=2823234 RepID=UPI0037831032
MSSFLRYTLVNESTGAVSLAQEVETLKLYLEIEKMRLRTGCGRISISIPA